jgi:hypothetical protein
LHRSSTDHTLSCKRNTYSHSTSSGTSASASCTSSISPRSLHSYKSCRPLPNVVKGDIHLIKNPKVFRFLYQNINGLCLTTFDKRRATVIRMLDLHCDLVGINEHCANWKLHSLKQICQSILQTVFKNNSLIVSTVPISAATNYLPGGTANISLGVWNSRILSPLYDPSHMGRWTGATYCLSDTRKLHVLTAYRVFPNTLRINPSLSTYWQQVLMMKQNGHLHPDPRAQFLLDITAFIQSLEITSDDYLMLSLDAKNTSDNHDVIQDLCDECHLLDMYMAKHADEQQFPTHELGSVKIDFLLCSPNLLPYVNKVGYIRFHEAFDSDHRAIYCDISTDLIGIARDPPPPLIRMVGTTSTNAEGENFIRHLHYHLQRHKIYSKLETMYLQVTAEDTNLTDSQINEIMISLNKMDTIIADAMLHSEKTQCKRRPTTMYSNALNQANLRVQYWNVLAKITRQRITTSDRLLFIEAQFTPESHNIIAANTEDPRSAYRYRP